MARKNKKREKKRALAKDRCCTGPPSMPRGSAKDLSRTGPSSAHSDILSASIPDALFLKHILLEEIQLRGLACIDSENYSDAEALYCKGIEVLTSMLDAKEDIGIQIISKQKDFKDENAKALKKGFAILYANRSFVRLQMSKVSEALNDATLAVQNFPAYAMAHCRRGQARCALGDAAGAWTSFKKALELDPNNKALKKEVNTAIEKMGLPLAQTTSAGTNEACGECAAFAALKITSRQSDCTACMLVKYRDANNHHKAYRPGGTLV